MTSNDEQIIEYIDTLKERAKNFEKSLLSLNIKSEGNISLTNAYFMPYMIREEYIKEFNSYMEVKNKISE